MQEMLGHADISTTQIYTHVARSYLHQPTSPSTRAHEVARSTPESWNSMFADLIAKGRKIFKDLDTYGYSDVPEAHPVHAMDVLGWIAETRGLVARTFGADSEEIERCWDYSKNLLSLPPGPVEFDVPSVLRELQIMLTLLIELGVRVEGIPVSAPQLADARQSSSVMQQVSDGMIHKMAVLSKEHYSVARIDDLFRIAGAEPAWFQPTTPVNGERVTRFRGWVNGIKTNAPGRADEIHRNVAAQMVENAAIPASDRDYLRKHVLGEDLAGGRSAANSNSGEASVPKELEELLIRLIRGLPRAMYPLKHRRKPLVALQFDNEYDVQSLFHSLLRPWIKDIRVEEYTPSYAGKSARIDFLLPRSGIVIELKYVRDVQHAKSVGDELRSDIGYYRAHPQCNHLWAVVYDPHALIQNPAGITAALDGPHAHKEKSIDVKTFILSAALDL